jgi:hypothetical protein
VEHITAVGPLLAGIARVLRPGGLLWATTPHARGISARILGASWSVVDPPSHLQLFSIRGLRKLLRRSGFDEVLIDAEGVNPQELLRRGRVTSRERIESGYALNAFFEEHRGRRFVKRVLNRALAIVHLGDTLKVSARRA